MIKLNYRLLIVFVLCLGACNSSSTKSKDDYNAPDSASKNDVDALRKKASLYYSSDNYQKAYNAYSELIKLDSLNGEFYYNRGNVEGSLRMFEQARMDFFHAVDLKYRIADSYYSIGLSYFFTGDNNLASEYIKKCLKLNPEDKKAKLMLKNLEEIKRRRLNH